MPGLAAFGFDAPSLGAGQNCHFILLRTCDPGERDAETRSSQAPTADRPPFLFHGACRTLGVYIRHIPRPRLYC
jgi:hypothetical protein